MLRHYLKKTKLFNLYKWFKYERWQPQTSDRNTLLESFFKKNPQGVLIQIGAFDGVTVDPLLPFINSGNWKAILVEPQKIAYTKLVSLYSKNRNVSIENVAIHKNDGFINLYKPSSSETSVLASFSKQHVKKHFETDVDIQTEKVNTVRFDTLLKKHNIETIDLLVIDTEGYDYEILKQIDFAVYKINMLIYEYEHLSHSDYRESLKLLKNNGYELYKDGIDIIGKREG